MILSRENRSTGERRVPLSICQSQIPHRLSQISCSKDETRGGLAETWVLIYQTTRCHVAGDITVLNKLARHDRIESGKK